MLTDQIALGAAALVSASTGLKFGAAVVLFVSSSDKRRVPSTKPALSPIPFQPRKRRLGCGRLGLPNPGGVGPMTRAMLLNNVVALAEERHRP
jgi:hypothetical protein